MTLTEFLLLRVAEDEELARSVMEDRSGNGPSRAAWGVASLPEPAVSHVLAWGPVRVLAECAAKRAIVEWHTDAEDCCEERYGPMVFDAEPELSAGVDLFGNLTMRQSLGYEPHIGCVTLMMLAAVYRDHPDYDETWRP